MNTMDKDKMAQWNKTYKEDQIAKLDQQGRHRSEWCYADYDGRKDGSIPHGAGYQEIPTPIIGPTQAKWQSTK